MVLVVGLRAIKRWHKKRRQTQYSLHKEIARGVIHDRLKYFSSRYGFSFNRVAIRDTKRSWGSCSSKGNLNFSYKLLFLSPCLRDYVIVHELCHLRELNHGQPFWLQVAGIMPDYKIRMQSLRTLERTHGTSIKALQKLQKETQNNNVCIYHL